MKEKILIVDDEECIRLTFSEFLLGGRYRVETTASLSGCIKKMQTGSFDLLFLDIGLGLDNGIEAIEGLKILQPDCKIVIITGALNSISNAYARRYGAEDYLVKPIRQQSLLYIAQKVLAHKDTVN